ncbi:helix-turn-helix domain-containing protein [Nonomuraea sp. NPDC050540]|uniref:helix-turn-helix domain-containing protein n=1 Tax=Nonomuraea sp. NPDC050540 TaxID=3364367 RepID=UPI0037B9CA5A
MRDTWTIGELAERAADALRPGLQRANGRIREVPGERLIRWYTTIGLVDPPLTRRGRLAQYGRRHLLQVVAVKRLQAEGHSIAEIQTRLTGATDSMLEATAHLEPPGGDPGGDLGGHSGGDLPDGTRDQGSRPHFWASHPTTEPTPHTPSAPATPAPAAPTAAGPEGSSRAPAEPFPASAVGAPQAAPGAATQGSASEVVHGLARDAAQESARDAAQESAPEAAQGTAPEAAPKSAPAAAREEAPAAVREGVRRPDRGSGRDGRGGRVSGVWLAPGVALVLDSAGRTPTDDDIEAVLAAAGPLLQVLQERKLT